MEEYAKKYDKMVALLEYYGVRIEKTEVGVEDHRIYLSVPELSTIRCEDKSLDPFIKTSEGLIAVAKKCIRDALIDIAGRGEDDDNLDIYVDTHVKFFAKIRKGETWNHEMGKARLVELSNEAIAASEYMEV